MHQCSTSLLLESASTPNLAHNLMSFVLKAYTCGSFRCSGWESTYFKPVYHILAPVSLCFIFLSYKKQRFCLSNLKNWVLSGCDHTYIYIYIWMDCMFQSLRWGSWCHALLRCTSRGLTSVSLQIQRVLKGSHVNSGAWRVDRQRLQTCIFQKVVSALSLNDVTAVVYSHLHMLHRRSGVLFFYLGNHFVCTSTHHLYKLLCKGSCEHNIVNSLQSCTNDLASPQKNNGMAEPVKWPKVRKHSCYCSSLLSPGWRLHLSCSQQKFGMYLHHLCCCLNSLFLHL